MHYLCSISPLELAKKPIAGYPTRRNIGDPGSYTAPPGYIYIPDLPQPNYDRNTQRLERELTIEGYGWRIVDLTAEEIQNRVVPQVVSRRQLFLALAKLSQPVSREDIRLMLSNDELGLIEFEEAREFNRNHPLIEQLANQLGLRVEDVDNIFISANKL